MMKDYDLPYSKYFYYSINIFRLFAFKPNFQSYRPFNKWKRVQRKANVKK